jgi:hypothetical protein
MNRSLVLLSAMLCLAGCGSDRPETLADRVAPGPVFLLGFDGLTPELVDQYREEGLLPAFSRLAETGATGRIRSTIPMISPPAWTTVSTGTLPGDHGVWSFWIPEGDNPRGRFVDARARLAPAIWQDLTALGRSVGVINVPVTCPPDSVNGFMIAGFPYPEGAPLTWPPELEAEIVDRGYERDAWLGPPEPGTELEWLRTVRRVGETRRKIALDLLFRDRPDFSFVVFTTPDRIQHHLWKFHDPQHPRYRADAPDELKTAIRDVYVWCDSILAEVMDRLPADATLMVLSDHGFGPAYLGLSKATITAQAGAHGPASAESRNLFGGDFYLGDADSTARAEFADHVRSLRGPGGEPLVGEVHDTHRTLIRGFGQELGPDVVAEEAEGYVFMPGIAEAPVVVPLGEGAFSGWHRRLGVFGAWGRSIEPGPVRDVDLSDVPALAMHILGERIPRRYNQNLPRRLFPDGAFVERPMRYSGDTRDGFRRPGESPAVGIDPAVAEQIRSLGYLD